MPSSVADALFGKTRQALLALLFGDPDREYYTRELVRLAGRGASQVQKELEALTTAGLVVREPRAHLVWFKANRDAAIFPELVALVAKTFGIGDVLRHALEPHRARIAFAFIYGSIARGEQRATSDVDLLIVGNVLLSELEPDLHEAETRLRRRLAPTIYTREEFPRLRHEHFLRAVLAKPKIYLIGDASDVKAAA